MKKAEVCLVPLEAEDREQFIRDNQWAFKYGALIEFGERDNHWDEDGEIISRSTIEQCLDEPGNKAYRIIFEGRKVGGLILKIDPAMCHNHLELFFVAPEEHGKGIGYGAWLAVEALYPETRIWETCTPYFEKGIYTSMLTNADFILWSFGASTILNPACLQMNLVWKDRMKCSGL